MRRDDDEHGFTLIELLVVVIIIGILAAIAIPVFLRQRQSGYDAQAKSDLRNLAQFEEIYFVDNARYTDVLGAGGIADFVQSRDVSNVTVELVDAAGTAPSANATLAYCITALAKSGTTWVYNSARGGIQARGSTCP